MSKRIILLGLLVATAAGGAASPVSAQPNDVDLLPLLDVERGPRSRTSQTPVGGYVRFWVERAPTSSDAAQRLYSRERRTWLQRFFIGRSRSRVLTARIAINRPHVISQTVTLAAASHDSNRRKGESWSSELGDARFLTPYFRVEQGITASVEVSLSASATVDADVTRNVLSILERGAKLVAPSSQVVTSLTSSELTQSADFVDTSISRLFGQAVAERAQSDFQAESWRSGRHLAEVRAVFPMGSHLWSNEPGDQSAVGTWRIFVSEPIVSIFSTVPLNPRTRRAGTDGHSQAALARCDVDHPQAPPGRRHENDVENHDHGENYVLEGQDKQACIAFSGVSPGSVLGLQVGENLTLGQALRGDSGIAAAVQRFQSAAAASGTSEQKRVRTGQVAREVCNLVAERTEALGLNAYDAAAAVWAFAWNGSLADDLDTAIWKSDCSTAKLAKRLRLNDPPSSAAEQGAQADTSRSGPEGVEGQQPPPVGDESVEEEAEVTG